MGTIDSISTSYCFLSPCPQSCPTVQIGHIFQFYRYFWHSAAGLFIRLTLSVYPSCCFPSLCPKSCHNVLRPGIPWTVVLFLWLALSVYLSRSYLRTCPQSCPTVQIGQIYQFYRYYCKNDAVSNFYDYLCPFISTAVSSAHVQSPVLPFKPVTSVYAQVFLKQRWCFYD